MSLAIRAPVRCIALLTIALATCAGDSTPSPVAQSSTSLADLIAAVHKKREALADSRGMKQSYLAFIHESQLPPSTVAYSDWVTARLLFGATRDAGFWNLHWDITNQPPNSGQVWRQWRSIKDISVVKSTATAKCDELSALYAFLALRAGVHGIGLFWPAPNHTVAVWVLHPAVGGEIRIVVPTTQIALSENDMFGTKKFNPWSQKTIFEYTRRDAPNSYVIPKPLYEFLLQQIDKYAGATDATLQKIRYLREGVLCHNWTPQAAASEALRVKACLNSEVQEDSSALQNFANDMGSAQ
jgi:hypothetical protein